MIYWNELLIVCSWHIVTYRDTSWHMTTWHVRVTLCMVPGTDRRMHAMQYSVQTLIMFANNELIKGSPVTCVWNNFKCSQFECKMQCIILIALGLNFIPWTQGLTSTPSREGSSKSEIEMFFMKLKLCLCLQFVGRMQRYTLTWSTSSIMKKVRPSLSDQK